MATDTNRDTFLAQVRRNSVALISLVVALSSLGYNTWRNEETEANRNVRAAGFAIIQEIAHLQRVIFEIHYSESPRAGIVEEGWVDIQTLQDLADPMPAEVQAQAKALYETWQSNTKGSGLLNDERYKAVDQSIDALRRSAKQALRELD